jgi:hypothetical protein
MNRIPNSVAQALAKALSITKPLQYFKVIGWLQIKGKTAAKQQDSKIKSAKMKHNRRCRLQNTVNNFSQAQN